MPDRDRHSCLGYEAAERPAPGHARAAGRRPSRPGYRSRRSCRARLDHHSLEVDALELTVDDLPELLSVLRRKRAGNLGERRHLHLNVHGQRDLVMLHQASRVPPPGSLCTHVAISGTHVAEHACFRQVERRHPLHSGSPTAQRSQDRIEHSVELPADVFGQKPRERARRHTRDRPPGCQTRRMRSAVEHSTRIAFGSRASTKRLLPWSRGPRWRGSAIRFPKPPLRSETDSRPSPARRCDQAAVAEPVADRGLSLARTCGRPRSRDPG